MATAKPLGIISDTNQSGLILILTALALCFVLVSFAIRIYIRIPHKLWKWDDNLLTVATSSLVFYEVHLGLGNQKIMNDDHKASELVKKYYFANDFLYLLVLVFSKAAVGSLFLRLTSQRSHTVAIWSILGLCAAWFVLSVLLISIGSSWTQAFHTPFGRWLGVGITDSITELGFVLMAAYLVAGLHMNKVQKSIVVFAFALRLLVIPACGIRLYYLDPSTLSNKRTLAISLAVVCTQIQLGYGIMAASVTVLKPFMAVYEKPLGYTGYDNPNRYAANQTSSTQRSFKMDRVGRSNGSPGGGRNIPIPDPTQGFSYNSASATGGARTGSDQGHERDGSIHSHDSRRLIIERKTDWSVRYEEAESHKSNTSEIAGSV